MNGFKWFIMSGRKKLLCEIKCAKSNEQRLHLKNGIVLDFSVPNEQTIVYRVTPKDQTDNHPFYMVDAPNEYIARWCGANLYNNEFIAFKTAKDMEVEEFRLWEERNETNPNL